MKRILMVFGAGGPPIDYVLPRMRIYGDIYACIIAEEPNEFQRIQLVNWCKEIIWDKLSGASQGNRAMVSRIVQIARKIKADAVVTFDEFLVVPVAHAAESLGLRGAGPNAILSRDKWRMRESFKKAGVKSPEFCFVSDSTSLSRACDVLGFPFLLKVTSGAGSIGHAIVRDHESAIPVWRAARKAMQRFAENVNLHHVENVADPVFVAEKIINGTTESWYKIPGFGNYVSVEGIACGGVYYPIGITSRLPTVFPFTEVGNQTPCILSAIQQLMIAECAKHAVNAFDLQFCGTHTEIMLMAQQELCVIESAARLPGCMNVPQLETVFGVDMIGMLMQALLEGHCPDAPKTMLFEGGKGAAGTLALLPLDEDGQPWEKGPSFKANVDWNSMVSHGTRVQVDWSHTLDEGKPIPVYEPLLGALNAFGLLYMEAVTPQILMQDQYSIRRGIRSQLNIS